MKLDGPQNYCRTHNYWFLGNSCFWCEQRRWMNRGPQGPFR